jgi:hypothetical protein
MTPKLTVIRPPQPQFRTTGRQPTMTSE